MLKIQSLIFIVHSAGLSMRVPRYFSGWQKNGSVFNDVRYMRTKFNFTHLDQISHLRLFKLWKYEVIPTGLYKVLAVSLASLALGTKI